MLRFEWNPNKANDNLKKHGVSFNEAATVFGDPFSVTYYDPDHSIDEKRYITVGHSDMGRIFIIAHTDRAGSIRIISARKVTRRERKYYEES